MSIFTEYQKILELENERVFHEFDLGNFLRTASLSLNKDTRIADMKKIHSYSDILRGSIENLKTVKFDRSETSLKTILTKASINPIFNKPLNLSTKIIVKPQVINEYIKFINEKLVDCAEGRSNIDTSEIISMSDRVKSQSVDSNVDKISIIGNIKSSLVYEKITPDYIKANIIPFIQSYETKKNDIYKEATDLLTVAEKAENGIVNTISRIDMMCNGESINFEIKAKLRKLSYSILTSLISVISYATSMMLKKMDIFNSNTLICNTIFMKYNTGDVLENPIAESSMDTVIDLSTGNVAHDFLTGQIGAFKELANNTYEFHTGLSINPDTTIKLGDDYRDSNVEFSGGYSKYDKTPYDEGFRVFSMINQGLDVVSSKTDDYLQVDVKLPDEAGFLVPLDKKFARALSEIEDLSKYSHEADIHPNGSVNIGLYRSMLNEIRDYPENIQKISNLAMTTNIRIESLIERFKYRINGEFKHAAATEELKNWICDFKEEFYNFITKISFAYINRLRKLSLELMKIINTRTSNPDAPKLPNSIPIEDIDPSDYSESVYDMIKDLEYESNINLFNEVEKSYYIEREMVKRGKILIFEADIVPMNNSNGTNKSTAPKVSDNSNNIGQGSAMIKKIVNRCQEWFTKLLDSFKNNMAKLTSHNDSKWVIQNQQYLTTRSYNNVTVELLPYTQMSPDTIVSDLNSCANAVRGLSPQVIQSIKSKNELYAKLFPFMKGGQINTEQPFGEQVKNYYKCGSYTISNTVQISNGELKTYVTSTMLPYVVNFQNRYMNQINSEADGVKKALTDFLTKVDTVGPQNVPVTPTQANTPTTTSQNVTATASYIDPITGYLIFEEGNTNTEVSMSEKSKWVVELVQVFTGSVHNAIRDREKDYIRTLVQLCPKQGETKAPTQIPETQELPIVNNNVNQ